MHRVSVLLADVFGVFATPKAQAEGVTFDPVLCGIWAEALRQALSDIRALEDAFARITHERDQLLAIAQDADLVVYTKAGAPAPAAEVRREPMLRLVSSVVDLSPILAREIAANAQQQPGGAS